MRFGALALLLVATACATAGNGGDRDGPREMISRTEIDEAGVASAYDLVTSLRPEWLHGRGLRTLSEAVGAETLVVYIDNARLGAPERMRDVALGSVRYLRYFSPPQANHRWGAGHLQGAILISTRDP